MHASRYAVDRPVRSAAAESSRPKPPETCGSCGASIRGPGEGIVFAVTQHDGRVFVGEPHRGAGHEPETLRFVRWIARCNDCYLRDVTNAKRDVHTYIDGLNAKGAEAQP